MITDNKADNYRAVTGGGAYEDLFKTNNGE